MRLAIDSDNPTAHLLETGSIVAMIVLVPASILIPVSIEHPRMISRELFHLTGIVAAFCCFVFNCRSWALAVEYMACKVEGSISELNRGMILSCIIGLKISSILILVLTVTAQGQVLLPSFLLALLCFFISGTLLVGMSLRSGQE